MLVGRATVVGEAPPPQGRIDLGYGRASGRNLPPIKRPEMDPGAEALAEKAQPEIPE